MLLLSSPTRSQRCGVLNHLLFVSAVPAQNNHYHQFPWTSGRMNPVRKRWQTGFHLPAKSKSRLKSPKHQHFPFAGVGWGDSSKCSLKHLPRTNSPLVRATKMGFLPHLSLPGGTSGVSRQLSGVGTRFPGWQKHWVEPRKVRGLRMPTTGDVAQPWAPALQD